MIAIKNGDVGGFLEAEDILFGGGVGFHGAVAVEVVGEDVGDDGDVGGPAAGALGRWTLGVSSSMKEESSRTTRSVGRMWGRSRRRERPMLPPRKTRGPSWVGSSEDWWSAALRAWWMRAVVVDLPTEPVMPTVKAGQRSRKRLISVVVGTPAARAAWTKGDLARSTAGLTTRRSAWSRSAMSWPPRW